MKNYFFIPLLFITAINTAFANELAAVGVNTCNQLENTTEPFILYQLSKLMC